MEDGTTEAKVSAPGGSQRSEAHSPSSDASPTPAAPTAKAQPRRPVFDRAALTQLADLLHLDSTMIADSMEYLFEEARVLTVRAAAGEKTTAELKASISSEMQELNQTIQAQAVAIESAQAKITECSTDLSAVAEQVQRVADRPVPVAPTNSHSVSESDLAAALQRVSKLEELLATTNASFAKQMEEMSGKMQTYREEAEQRLEAAAKTPRRASVRRGSARVPAASPAARSRVQSPVFQVKLNDQQPEEDVQVEAVAADDHDAPPSQPATPSSEQESVAPEDAGRLVRALAAMVQAAVEGPIAVESAIHLRALEHGGEDEMAVASAGRALANQFGAPMKQVAAPAPQVVQPQLSREVVELSPKLPSIKPSSTSSDLGSLMKNLVGDAEKMKSHIGETVRTTVTEVLEAGKSDLLDDLVQMLDKRGGNNGTGFLSVDVQVMKSQMQKLSAAHTALQSQLQAHHNEFENLAQKLRLEVLDAADTGIQEFESKLSDLWDRSKGLHESGQRNIVSLLTYHEGKQTALEKAQRMLNNKIDDLEILWRQQAQPRTPPPPPPPPPPAVSIAEGSGQWATISMELNRLQDWATGSIDRLSHTLRAVEQTLERHGMEAALTKEQMHGFAATAQILEASLPPMKSKLSSIQSDQLSMSTTVQDQISEHLRFKSATGSEMQSLWRALKLQQTVVESVVKKNAGGSGAASDCRFLRLEDSLRTLGQEVARNEANTQAIAQHISAAGAILDSKGTLLPWQTVERRLSRPSTTASIPPGTPRHPALPPLDTTPVRRPRPNSTSASPQTFHEQALSKGAAGLRQALFSGNSQRTPRRTPRRPGHGSGLVVLHETSVEYSEMCL